MQANIRAMTVAGFVAVFLGGLLPGGALAAEVTPAEARAIAKEANWLPAPDGPVYLVMRLYWPKESQPSILPAGEGTWKPPAIVASK